LNDNGFITMNVLEKEIDRMKHLWASEDDSAGGSDAMLRSILGEEEFAKIDLIDRIQLAGVIQVCRECITAAEAGRKLFTAPDHAEANHSDLVTKYLKKFELRFSDCAKAMTANG